MTDINRVVKSARKIMRQGAGSDELRVLLFQIAIKGNQPDTSKPIKTKNRNNVIPLKPTRMDYYKRMLLAAEIVHQLHRQPTLGHLKLQKLIYLCQKTEQIQLPTNFLQQAAGLYDPKMARSIDKQLKDKKWFLYQREETLKYVPPWKMQENTGQTLNNILPNKKRASTP